MKIYELRTYSWCDGRVKIDEAIDIALQDSRLFANLDEAQAEALAEFNDYLEAIGETDPDQPELLPENIDIDFEVIGNEHWAAWDDGPTGWKAVVYEKEISLADVAQELVEADFRGEPQGLPRDWEGNL